MMRIRNARRKIRTIKKGNGLCHMSIFSGIKNHWNAWLKRMADSNKEAFHGEVPDCCKLKQQNQPGQKTGEERQR